LLWTRVDRRRAAAYRAGHPELQPAVCRGRRQMADCKFAIEEDKLSADAW
jgi:hypothetical protein